MQIAKAVVLAGRPDGSPWPRLGARSPQLAPVANRPVLFHALDAVRLSGVRAAVLVIDEDTGEEIRKAVGDGSHLGLDVQYVRASARCSVVETIRAAADRLGTLRSSSTAATCCCARSWACSRTSS
jgi:glucose-1-phosphate thymidylyltransferase